MTDKTICPEFYVTEEKAMAPGIAGDWPQVIPKPDTRHGRLVKVEGLGDAIDRILSWRESTWMRDAPSGWFDDMEHLARTYGVNDED